MWVSLAFWDKIKKQNYFGKSQEQMELKNIWQSVVILGHLRLRYFGLVLRHVHANEPFGHVFVLTLRVEQPLS